MLIFDKTIKSIIVWGILVSESIVRNLNLQNPVVYYGVFPGENV